MISVRELQETAVRAWFTTHFRCLRPNEPPALGEPVPRRQLRRELNAVLAACNLPLASERGDLWARWFLGDVLQLDRTTAASGKHVVLVPLCRIVDFRRTLLTILAGLPQ
jgi:hypothetical protein